MLNLGGYHINNKRRVCARQAIWSSERKEGTMVERER